MNPYDKYILPRIVDFTCGLKPMMKQREKLVPLAQGRVLEIGIGSGLNLPFYAQDKVEHLWGLDPSRETWALRGEGNPGLAFEVEFVEASAERIPLGNNSVDTVLITYTICTIADVPSALAEARRVLKKGGKLLFCEHGLAPDVSVRRWQNRLNPIWKLIGGGCNLNRPIPELVEASGFSIVRLDSMYIPGWKPASFNYWGSALRQ